MKQHQIEKIDMRNYLLLIIAMFLVSCEKEGQENFGREYITYEEEIFLGDFINIYGTWIYLYSQGGWGGAKTVQLYDTLKIWQIGNFYEVDTLNRKIQNQLHVIRQDKDFLEIGFYNKNQQYYKIRIVQFLGNDTLLLNSPCCDFYDDFYVRGN